MQLDAGDLGMPYDGLEGSGLGGKAGAAFVHLLYWKVGYHPTLRVTRHLTESPLTFRRHSWDRLATCAIRKTHAH